MLKMMKLMINKAYLIQKMTGVQEKLIEDQ
jgi:hypothetical protein